MEIPKNGRNGLGWNSTTGYLTPYSRIRYHQSQFEHVLPTNAQEAFNRVHSSLRSCIERSFGVLKKWWKILRQMSSFNKKTQIDVIMATFALHNYIRRNDSTDTIFFYVGRNPQNIPTEELGETSGTANLNTQGTNNEMRQAVKFSWIGYVLSYVRGCLLNLGLGLGLRPRTRSVVRAFDSVHVMSDHGLGPTFCLGLGPPKKIAD
ncbi:hypothetical protein LXL04_031575 [Taraxacum kok-saghyz]